MIFPIILLIIAVALAGNVAFAAVFGFMAIFASSPIFAMSIGITIEVAKLAGISYLYRHWEEISKKMKYSMLIVTLTTVLLSAIGLFGYLSRAHLENANPVVNNTTEIVFIDERIQTEQDKIDSAKAEIDAFNAEIQKLIEFDKVSGKTGSKATREQQEPRRNTLNEIIKSSQNEITELRNDKFELEKKVNSFTAEIGPLKYVADVIWGEGEDNIDKAVRLMIGLVMVVLDPFAILLLMGANGLLMKRQKKEGEGEDDISFQESLLEPLKREETEDVLDKKSDDKMDIVLDKLTTVADSVDTLKSEADADKKREQLKNDIRKNNT